MLSVLFTACMLLLPGSRSAISLTSRPLLPRRGRQTVIIHSHPQSLLPSKNGSSEWDSLIVHYVTEDIENKIKLKLKLRQQGQLEWRKSLSGSNLPGLCGWQNFLPDKPFLRIHLGTSPGGFLLKKCPAGSWGSRTSNRAPWTRTPGIWECSQSTRHKAGLVWNGTASCGQRGKVEKEAEICSVPSILTEIVINNPLLSLCCILQSPAMNYECRKEKICGPSLTASWCCIKYNPISNVVVNKIHFCMENHPIKLLLTSIL